MTLRKTGSITHPGFALLPFIAFAIAGCSASNNGSGSTAGGSGGGGSTAGGGSAGATPGGGGTAAVGGGVVANGGAVGNGGAIGAGGVVGASGAIGAGGSLGGGGVIGAGGVVGNGGAIGAGGMVVMGAGGSTSTGPGCLMGTGDYSKAGPYMVKTKSVDLASESQLAGAASPTTFTIFYPATLDANCPAPVIAWGNGTTVTGSQVYGFFNNNAASWGMVVIASDNPNVASSPFLATGIDYMLAQNKDPMSEFYGKLSGRAGTSGHSQGAFAATTATTHMAVQAEVQVEGGGLPKQGIAFLALSGTADNIVGTGPPTQSYGAATGPSMLAIYTGADHLTTPTLGGAVQGDAGTIQFTRFYTAWFRCFLADDANACALFKGGQNCGVCKDPNWDTLQTKNM